MGQGHQGSGYQGGVTVGGKTGKTALDVEPTRG